MKSAAVALPATDFAAHPFFGPLDRRPSRYRGPHRLSHHGWLNFVERLERREEVSAVLAAVATSRRVLDVGGGTGELTRAVAARVERCVTVEPHARRVEVLQAPDGSAQAPDVPRTGGIEVLPGHAEALPFPDASFDAVLACWVLPYAEDPDRAVREMARVCDRSAPGGRVVLIGGAPDNELVSLLNEVCVPLAGEPHDHQGHLLADAVRTLSGLGFTDISLHRTEAALHFSEPDLEERITAAAALLTDFWYEGHPRAAEMREALRPALHRHFALRPYAIGDQGIVLVAV
ncbi:methyltransferase domain-containing protein [Streptomyces roseirectus]|uniref:Methyltransferase domain-containing protein n=1 Tax=Streptomyces roseirectus TaxID=2768066 RepID=A0A7H0ITG5_9ACTN|nr:methyltransferase domain-containing protein [Streptomyces roseirectus]